MNVYNGIDTYTITFKDYSYNSNNIKSFDKKMNIPGNYILLWKIFVWNYILITKLLIEEEAAS